MLKAKNIALFLAIFVALTGDSSAKTRRHVHPMDPPAQSQQSATPDQRGTEQSPLVVKVQPAPPTPEEAKHLAAQEANKSSADWLLVEFNGGLVVVGILQLVVFGVVFGWQGYQLQQTVKTAKESADALMTAERAYVKISHPSPGIEQLDESGHIWMTVSIKNHGKTPGRVSDVHLRPVAVTHGEQLPETPDYTIDPETGHRGPPLRAFLVTQEEFNHSRFYLITPDQMEKVKDLLADLYMIGYVDYRDQFGERHRGGYARQYFPMVDLRRSYASDEEFIGRNNLSVVAQPGYNYDRIRARGEGNDWDE
jgi:hypothetical protein